MRTSLCANLSNQSKFIRLFGATQRNLVTLNTEIPEKLYLKFQHGTLPETL